MPQKENYRIQRLETLIKEGTMLLHRTQNIDRWLPEYQAWLRAIYNNRSLHPSLSQWVQICNGYLESENEAMFIQSISDIRDVLIKQAYRECDFPEWEILAEDESIAKEIAAEQIAEMMDSGDMSVDEAADFLGKTED